MKHTIIDVQFHDKPACLEAAKKATIMRAAGALPQDCGMNHETDLDHCPVCGYLLEAKSHRPIAGSFGDIRYLKCTNPDCKYQESI